MQNIVANVVVTLGFGFLLYLFRKVRNKMSQTIKLQIRVIAVKSFYKLILETCYTPERRKMTYPFAHILDFYLVCNDIFG